nr:reverse transcriptase domain-containing protein [Tanacetum cinerariifolium]
MGKVIAKLHAMLKLHEKGIIKKVETPVVLSIRGGKIQKNSKKKPQGAKRKDKGKTKVTYALKTKIPSPPKRDNLTKDSICHHCKEELDHQAKAKATPRKLVYVDSGKEAPDRSMTKGFTNQFSLESTGMSDTRGEIHSVGKGQKGLSRGKEPSHLRRSKRLKNRSQKKERARSKKSNPKKEGQNTKKQAQTQSTMKRAKLPRNIRVYEGNKDPEDHLSIFSSTAKQEEWSMPIWCKMFRQTLGRAIRIWFDDSDPKIFMHGHGHPELAKKLNEKIPKMVDEMFESQSFHSRRNGCKIEEAVASGKLAHLISDIDQINLKSGNQRRNDVKSRLRRCKASLVGFLGETYHPLGLIELWVTMGETGMNKTMIMKFTTVKCRSPHNVQMGRTRMRSIRAVVLTFHSMIKFPTDQGVFTTETSREALWECRQLEKMVGSTDALGQKGRGKKHDRKNSDQRIGKDNRTTIHHGASTENIPPGQTGHVSLLGGGKGTGIANGIPIQVFLMASKDDSQIRMAKDDEEKTKFHTEE